ncbi:MAG: Rieske 2Fe-2S domain-containing protein [Nitrospirae bacterium]|nr:Rieske 2Fe-2S domain-containing protein [Nitrospirota bacterium]
MKRRNFLKALMGVFGTVSVASFAYPLIRYLAPSGSAADQKKIVLSKQEIPIGGSKVIVFHERPAIVINRPDKGFIVLSKVCTHLGCLVEYAKDRNVLVCPCHAGTFDLEGNVISGPPPKPLPKLPLRVEGEQIIIG